MSRRLLGGYGQCPPLPCAASRITSLPSSTASQVTISQSSSALVSALLQGGGSPEGVSAYETSIF